MPRVRLGAEAELDVQQARRLRQVVDVERLAGDVPDGAVVGRGSVDAALDAAQTWARLRSPTSRVSAPRRGLDMQAPQQVARDLERGSRPRRACR